MNYPSLSVRAACAIAMLIAVPAWSMVRGDAVYAVDTTADLIDDDTSDGVCHTTENSCSLRAAIMQANASTAQISRIDVPAGTYVLAIAPTITDDDSSGDLNVGASGPQTRIFVIQGAGADTTILDANRIDRVLWVNESAAVVISSLTLRNGDSRQTPLGSGGGVFNLGSLSIEDCVLEENAGQFGGAIYNHGSVEIARSVIRTNTASVGAGLLTDAYAVIRNSSLTGNGVLEDGGGIYAEASVGDAFAYIVNTTISGNYANGDGGGIYANDGTTFLYNVSVIGNDADHDRDETGGIGGGLYVVSGVRFGVVNSLIADNTILSAPIAGNCQGAIEAYGLNLLDDREGCTTTTDDSHLGFVSVSTIGPLQDNGGPTLTHALLPGSEAIDSTFDNLGCVDETGSPLTTDQRGAERPVGARCDVGAYEFGATIPVDDQVFRDGFERGK